MRPAAVALLRRIEGTATTSLSQFAAYPHEDAGFGGYLQEP